MTQTDSQKRERERAPVEALNGGGHNVQSAPMCSSFSERDWIAYTETVSPGRKQTDTTHARA
eukprot:COSAG03_NODE_20028_length_325_cov_1.716814_2_plen_61_part_01